MSNALSQNLDTIAALQSSCVFGYQTNDPLAAVAEPDYFRSCASRLMANDLILICADAEQAPAWGLFLVERVDAKGCLLSNVAGLAPETVNGLTFLRSMLNPSAKRRKSPKVASRVVSRKDTVAA